MRAARTCLDTLRRPTALPPPVSHSYAGTARSSAPPLAVTRLTPITQSGRLHLAFARQTVVWNGHANVGLGVFDLDQCANCDDAVGIKSRASVARARLFSSSLTRPPSLVAFFLQAELSTMREVEQDWRS
jgi:hypothetical protein